MEATNNGQTFSYRLPSKRTANGGYTWKSFQEVNKHLAIGGVGGEPTLEWLKANVHDRIACKGVFQFGDQGAHALACMCLPLVEQEGASTHGTNNWAALSWVKDEFRGVRRWFDGRCDSQSQEIAALHQAIDSKMDHDAMIRAFDRLIVEVDALGAQVTQLSAQLAARDAHLDVAVTPTPQPVAARRRTWRDFFGF